MTVILRLTPLNLADMFNYDNKEWQVITIPTDPGLRGNLLKFTARSGILEKEFYMQVD